jgi:hypothetical protein
LVAETLAESGTPCRLTRLGMGARFSELCGSYGYLLSYHGLGLDDIRRCVDAALKR